MLLNKKYKTIYADPPWYFRSYSEKGEGRNATKHYDCMSLSDNDDYYFKKAHSISYAATIVIAMNLIVEEAGNNV